mgnify:CR=1 FL=1
MDRSDMMHRMYDIKGPLVAKKFAARGFEAVYCPTKEEALKQAISYIPETDVVSWGGSVSINEIGLRPYVLEHNPVIDRDSAKTPEERVELMRKALLCDTFLMGANAAVQDGQLINIDGNGNRVSSTLYGHQKVYFLVGVNKVAPDFEAALWRARNVAAPKRAQSMGCRTPCAAKADRCYDCKSPERICRGLAVLWARPNATEEMEVVLIGEALGM